ncbi:MAG: hypothetical protein WAO74_11540 [Polaribacter sp.]|uniref:hypothetical protein n=1 Tax=Polaribacter sp. TaxID=1920175 RepID=UPI003BB18AEF
MNNYQYIYIILSVIIWILGYFHTGKYVRPKWKIPGKFIFYLGISTLLVLWINHYSLIFIFGHQLLGLYFHTKVCKKHNINWFSCEPKEKYLKLQEKWAKGDFSKLEE